VFAHSGKHGETLVGNNVSATMFPSLHRALMIAEFYKVLLTLYYISHLSCQRQLTTKWKLGLREPDKKRFSSISCCMFGTGKNFFLNPLLHFDHLFT
jgi:hypothetical protein